jgi:hypothetical protein
MKTPCGRTRNSKTPLFLEKVQGVWIFSKLTSGKWLNTIAKNTEWNTGEN